MPTPTRVVFLDPADRQRTVALRARDGRPFRITAARILGEGFEVTGPAEAPAAEHPLQVL